MHEHFSQVERDVEDTYAEWGQKHKGPVVKDPDAQLLLNLRKGSKASRLESLKQANQAVAGKGSSAAHNKYHEFENISATDTKATQDSSCSDTDEGKDVETDDSDDYYMDLSKDKPKGDGDVVGFGVFVYNKSTKPLKPTYLSPTITTSSLEYIQTLLNDPPENKFTDFISNLVYTDAHTTSAVIYPEGNPELTSYISCASEVPLGTHVDVQATNTVLQEMFSDEAFFISTSKKITYYQRSPTNLTSSQSKEAHAEGEEEHKEDQLQTGRLFTKKSGSTNAMRRTTWFDLLLKSNIDRNEDHILGPSTIAIAKKIKEIIQKDELTISDLEDAGLEKLKLHYKNDVELEYHVDPLKAAVLSKAQWNSDEGDVSKPRSFEHHM
ncbi:hypothetical protein Tco_1217635 [Tanacetum coccineum]